MAKYRIRYSTVDIQEMTVLAADEDSAIERFLDIRERQPDGRMLRRIFDVTALPKDLTL